MAEIGDSGSRSDARVPIAILPHVSGADMVRTPNAAWLKFPSPPSLAFPEHLSHRAVPHRLHTPRAPGPASRARPLIARRARARRMLQEVKHPEARITHRGICASPDTIFGSHKRPRLGLTC